MSLKVVGGLLAQDLATVRPSVTTWSRLEPRPATPDLAPSLAAPVADPLWLLHRQWAFGELHGEDAGSPIDVRLTGDQAVPARYHPGPLGGTPSQVAVDYAHPELPLEVAVEREPVRGTHPRLAAAHGLQFLRLLGAEGAAELAPRFTAAFPLQPERPADPDADRHGAGWAAVMTGRALDGDALATAVRPLTAADGSVTGIPPGVSVPQSRQARAIRALTRFMAAYDATVTQPPDGEASAWRADRQEYALALSADGTGGTVLLQADEYTDGRLDWWAFLASGAPGLGNPQTPQPVTSMQVPAMLPSPVRYPGMPAARYWEFEDARVSLGRLEAGPTDLARLLLVEFGLVYGTDWWLVPVELPVGSLFTVTGLRVRDTFGVETAVGPSRNSDGRPWEMFELGQTGAGATRLADLFFLPPTLSGRLEGDPAEEVTLLRDEMANLAWGVERRVPGTSGEPVERALEAARLAVHQEMPTVSEDVRLVYRLMSPVPVNWIPFEPVATVPPTDPAYDLAFERRVLQRTVPDVGGGPPVVEQVHPRGLLLRSDPSLPVAAETPLRIAEEEIPREGAVVTRSFQYARWFGGASFLWMGRSKRAGRGEGSSGLRYDATDRAGGP
ncbi:hypothetical protein ABZ543_27040 [Streptomyces roseifaciens]